MGELRRELGLGYATLFGVGLILGAGIYVLIGRAAGMVGDAVWLSVAFSGLIAVSTAFSYAELSSIFTTAASTYTYVAEAFPGTRLLAFMAAWMLFFGGVAGAATAGLGFSSYFTRLFGLGESWIVPVTVALLLALSVLNWWGHKGVGGFKRGLHGYRGFRPPPRLPAWAPLPAQVPGLLLI